MSSQTHVGERRRGRARRLAVAAVGALILLLAGPPSAGGQEGTPAGEEPARDQVAAEQEVRLEEAPAETRRRATSLSEFAAGAKLKRPEGADDEPLVISNDNLDELGKGAILSEGVSVVPDLGSLGSGFGERERLRREWASRIEDQEARVEELQGRVDEIDGTVDDYQSAGVYFSSAHYRPGGVQDPVLDYRRDLEKKLSAEREKLDSMRRQAGRDGVQ